MKHPILKFDKMCDFIWLSQVKLEKVLVNKTFHAQTLDNVVSSVSCQSGTGVLSDETTSSKPKTTLERKIMQN